MEWIVHRLCARGRLQPKHMVWASEARGIVHIAEERNPARRRTMKVARVLMGGLDQVPPLHDVQLIASEGELWRLAGYELLADGPLQDECMVSQAWTMRPAPDQDLIDAETKLGTALRQLAELRGG